MTLWGTAESRVRAAATGIGVSVALLAGALALQGCVPEVTDENASQQTAPTPAPSPEPVPPGPVGPPGPDEPTEPDAVLPWLPPGPASPSDPPEQSWYLLLRYQDCAALDDAVRNSFAEPIWQAAAATCIAVASGDAAAWAEAEDQIEALDGTLEGGVEGLGCHGAAVYRTLERAIAFHAENPEVGDIKTAPEEGTACDQELYGVFAQDPTGGSGACGNRWFVLDARLLPTTVVTVDGAGVELTVGDREHLYFEMPSRPAGETSAIVARTSGGDDIGTVEYEHVETEQCESPSPEPSPSDSPAAQAP